MRFTIDDRVRLTFSPERLEDELFQEADGLTATVVERYQQSHLPDIDFYEVELDEPIEVNGRRIVVLSGLMREDLEPAEGVDEKINPAYLTKNAKAMKDEIKKNAKKDDDDPSAYTSHPNGGWKADYDKSGKPYKTKTSKHTAKFKEMFGESIINESEVDKALSNKAEKSGISKGILRKVYNRGLAAWKTGHRPGVTQHQWAMARVNSFATKGKGTWGKADKDLAKKVRTVNEEYDYKTETFKLNLSESDNRKTYLSYSSSRVQWLALVLDEIKTRYPDWDHEEEKKLVEYGLSKEPRFDLEDIELDQVWISYKIKPLLDDEGISEVLAELIAVSFVLNFQVWDTEQDDRAFTYEHAIEIKPEKSKVNIEIGKMPLVPTYLDIDMPDDIDPLKFKFEFQIGEFR